MPRSTRSSTPSDLKRGVLWGSGVGPGCQQGVSEVRPGASGYVRGACPVTSWYTREFSGTAGYDRVRPGASRGFRGDLGGDLGGVFWGRVRPGRARTTYDPGEFRRSTTRVALGRNRSRARFGPCVTRAGSGSRRTGPARPVHDRSREDRPRTVRVASARRTVRAPVFGPAGPEPRTAVRGLGRYGRAGFRPCSAVWDRSWVRPCGVRGRYDGAGPRTCSAVRDPSRVRPCEVRDVYGPSGFCRCTTVWGLPRVRPEGSLRSAR